MFGYNYPNTPVVGNEAGTVLTAIVTEVGFGLF